MKKLLMALSIMLGFTTIVTAQTGAPAKTAVKPATAKVVKMEKTVAPTTTTTGKAAAAKPVAATAKAKPTAMAAAPVKAGGTPDMRFKANKTTKGKS